MSDKAGKTEDKAKKPSLYIRTFGCQMNIRDSEYVIGLLLENGFMLANSIGEADIVLFNSCSVRKHAEDRLISNIAELAKLKKKRPDLVIGLIGCTAQNYKDDILKKLPVLDFSCGPGNEADLPGIIKDILDNRCAIVATGKVNEKKPELFPIYREHAFKAYISISEGCDNYCSYCVVPYVRGRERSRDMKDIVREAQDLADRGFKEITLLGQNVNSYKSIAYSVERIRYRKKLNAIRYPLNAKTSDFVNLLEQLNDIKGIERIRFMTSHPKDASSELFKAIRDLSKVCEHLHLPLQSGSDRILRLMNRGYARNKYLKLVELYRKYVPGGSITTDVIVGFPAESEKDFEDTFNLMKDAQFDGAFTFKYSPRPPAKSINLKDDVPKDVKERRLKTLMDAQCEISRIRNELQIGKIAEVLVDCQNEKQPGLLSGRTRTNKITLFDGDKKLIGHLINVNILSVKPHTLIGRMVE